MQRLENIFKKNDEFKICVEKRKEEVEYVSGDTVYPAVIVLFVAASVLARFFLKGVVVMGSSKPITMKVSAGCSVPLLFVIPGSRVPTA
jgi:hypothetical protein